MPDLAFGTSAYSRTRGNLPELPVINLFAEKAPTEQTGVVLQGRPGLVAGDIIGTGPIRGIFQSAGVIGGERYIVSGNKLFRDGVEHGTITGDGPVSFAASETELLVNAGASIHRTDGTTFSTVTFPDSANVTKVLFFGGLFIALRKDTHQFYWSDVLDGTTWDGLSFASAENQADWLYDALIVNDALLLFGAESVEFWAKTGDADLPFSPVEGRLFSKGVVAPGCAVAFDNSAAWIGRVGPEVDGGTLSLRVYIAGNEPMGISETGIEERLDLSETWSLWTFQFEGHEFLVVRLDQGSWLFDAATRQWCEFQSFARDNWRARCGLGGLFGDDETGQLWTLGPGYEDAGDVLESRFRAGTSIRGGSVTAKNIRISLNPGETGYLTGDYVDPTVEMRTSRDAGRTWGDWRQESAGAQGEYRTRVEWRRNGMFDDPGILAEFRITDPIPRRFSMVSVNEPSGGRSR